MFDTPLDAWYVWLGLSAASVAIFGVVVSLPTAPVPDAPAVADTIDRVSVTEYDTTASRTLDADAVRLEPRRIGLRNDAGTTHATLASPVVPVRTSDRLGRLLRGASPEAVFASPTALDRAVTRATRRDSTWVDADTRLVARHLSWGSVDVTLVGTTDAHPGNRHTPANRRNTKVPSTSTRPNRLRGGAT